MYYQCPDCGFKQKSEATKRIQCHKCGRSYLRRKAKKTDKSPDDGSDFHTYSPKDD